MPKPIGTANTSTPAATVRWTGALLPDVTVTVAPPLVMAATKHHVLDHVPSGWSRAAVVGPVALGRLEVGSVPVHEHLVLIVGCLAPAWNASIYGTAMSSIAVWSSPSAHLDDPSSVCAVP